jgi:hypothetical protein
MHPLVYCMLKRHTDNPSLTHSHDKNERLFSYFQCTGDWEIRGRCSDWWGANRNGESCNFWGVCITRGCKRNLIRSNVRLPLFIRVIYLFVFLVNCQESACCLNACQIVLPANNSVLFYLCTTAIIDAHYSIVNPILLCGCLTLDSCLKVWMAVSSLAVRCIIFFSATSCLLLLKNWQRRGQLGLM